MDEISGGKSGLRRSPRTTSMGRSGRTTGTTTASTPNSKQEERSGLGSSLVEDEEISSSSSADGKMGNTRAAKRAAAQVTPSPTASCSSSAVPEDVDSSEEDAQVQQSKKKKSAAKRKRRRATKSAVSKNILASPSSGGEAESKRRKATKKEQGKKRAVLRDETKEESHSSEKSPRAKVSNDNCAKAKRSVRRLVSVDKGGATSKKLTDQKDTGSESDDKDDYNDGSSDGPEQPGQPDGNGALFQPCFAIEYSKTGRATCRRCDRKIEKGEIRVAHTPLFRGKPGFRVYRHLECAVFSEEIQCAEDVDGCSDLEPDDYTKLAARVQESKAEIQRETEELDPDELVPVTFQGEIRDPPPGLSANLLPFQVEGVSWMYHQEVKKPTSRGGILADEMGMGKTLQTIATILDHKPQLHRSSPGTKYPPTADKNALAAEEKLWDASLSEWNHEMKMNNVPKSLQPKARGKHQPGGGARAGTLVICPVIALSQWKSEIEKFSESGTLTVHIYHGPNRASVAPRDMLRKFDVVLTTYQVLEADFRKMISPNRVKCPNCGGKFKIDKLRIHLKYFCGEGAQRTEAQARQRRNSDRNTGSRGRTQQRGGRGSPDKGKGRGAGKNSSKKKAFSTTKEPLDKGKASRKKSPQSAKKAKGVDKPQGRKRQVRIKGSSGLDSESELSIVEEKMETSVRSMSSTSTRHARPARSAAASAAKKLSLSAREWMDGSNDDEYDEDEESVAVVSSDESTDISSDVSPKKKRGRGTIKKATRSKDERSESDSSSSEDECLKKARDKQREALEMARTTKGTPKSGGKGRMKKSFAGAKEEKAMPKGKGGTKKSFVKTSKGGKKKKFGDEFDLGSSSDGSSDSFDSNDDFGIDMERLVEEAMEGSQMSVLHSLCWWRIVLDEAHMIKSRSTQTAQAAFSLIGIHRWCLSGTPLQNRVGEFYSLIRFLRIDPMAHYFCRSKNCDCKSLHYRMMNGKCQDCGHGSIQHFSHFNKYVLNPIQRDGYSGDGRRAMFVLKNEILDKCLLRRTKENRAEDMNLPPRIVTIKSVKLHPIEEDFYNALYTQTRSSFDDYVADGTLLNNYAHIFDLLMRMRQAVDHPYLVVFSKKDRQVLSPGAVVANGTTDCDICHEPPTDRVVSTCCQAAYCRSCVLEYMSGVAGLATSNNTPCPSCGNPFSIDLNQDQAEIVDDSSLSIGKTVDKGKSDCLNDASSIGMPSLKELPHVATGSILRRVNLAEFATSTKIEALTEELVKMRQRSPGSKAIVFSQFVNMLDLVRWRLHSDPCLANMGLGAKALHGGMNAKSRDEVLKDFREDKDVRVLLMSLKAGGVALNLTVANYIFLLDPWWNPAAEMQAIDRTHRLGQYRPIRAIRLIAENTVEERILQLQEKKRLVFDGTVGRDAGSLKMLTVDDMKSLFA